MGKVLILEDDPVVQRSIQVCLRREGFEAQGVFSCRDAKKMLLEDRYDLVIVDYQLSEDETGMELLRFLKTVCPEIPAIMISGCNEVGLPESARRHGAYAFLPKPYSQSIFINTCKRAIRLRKGIAEEVQL